MMRRRGAPAAASRLTASVTGEYAGRSAPLTTQAETNAAGPRRPPQADRIGLDVDAEVPAAIKRATSRACGSRPCRHPCRRPGAQRYEASRALLPRSDAVKDVWFDHRTGAGSAIP